MKTFLKSIFFILILELSFQYCARTSSPTGGPRDTLNPVLLQSTPQNGQTNFNETEFTLTFSEHVSADQLNQKLLATPKSDLKFKTLIKRNELTIKFEEPFQDSTTYNLNFLDAVVDITERNPVENLSIAFSTGPFIDSMSIQGTVNELFTQKPSKKITVGLYPDTDTLDLLKHSPVYFTNSNDSGNFSIKYIKDGAYKLLAYKDENNNVIFDPETEQHAFIPGIIQLDSAVILQKPLNALLQNVTPIKFINSRSIGPYMELKYNKQINEYTISPPGYLHNLIGEKSDAIRIYKGEETTYNDSITFYVQVYDSLSNASLDTIKNVFQDNYRKPTKYSIQSQLTKSVLEKENIIKLKFNKPSFSTDSLKVVYTKDSTYRLEPDFQIEWHPQKISATLKVQANPDSIIQDLLATLPADTTERDEDDPLLEVTPNFNLDVSIPTGSFYSVEKDTSNAISLQLRTATSNQYGSITIYSDTQHPSYVIQLLEGDKISYAIKNQPKATFSKVKPSTYTIRVLIDNNEDGYWSAGNLLQDIPPEEIYIYPEPTAIRENWEQELNITF